MIGRKRLVSPVRRRTKLQSPDRKKSPVRIGETKGEIKGEIKALTGLRIVAAVWVVLFAALGWLTPDVVRFICGRG